MKQQEITDRVRALADPILESGGFELVEIQYRREQPGWVLRLFVDRLPAADSESRPTDSDGRTDPDEPGVTLNDCTDLSRAIGRILDVEDVIPNPYTLEVSSPGLNRLLTRPRDFIRFSMRTVAVRLEGPEGKRRLKGRLLGMEEGRIRLEVDGRTEIHDMAQVKVIRLEPEIRWSRD